jgi:hypothetical protein
LKEDLRDKNMTEPYMETETDRTKSQWVARAYNEFVKETGRSKTTQRGLFYYALQRKASDYPICGGFVGEIRIMRPYHEKDGEKLPKWMNKARMLGYIPTDAIVDEIPGEHVIYPSSPRRLSYSIEIWLNKSGFNPLLSPVCEKYGVTLVSVHSRASNDALDALYARCTGPTIIICLCDLSPNSAFFAEDLAAEIAGAKPSGNNNDIKLKCFGLLPEQILAMKTPMVQTGANSKKDQERFKLYLKSQTLDPKKMVELDALEVYYPGGIAGFLDECLTQYVRDSNLDKESWLLARKASVFPSS